MEMRKLNKSIIDDDGIKADEKESFLDNSNHKSPKVKLTPSWESHQIDNDELNFHKPSPRSDPQPPKDGYYIVFLILILHGIGILTPWNMFITAEKYFTEYKLLPDTINTTNVSNTTSESNSTLIFDGKSIGGHDFRKDFLSYIGVASQVPNVICNALNLFFQFGGGNLTLRITIAIAVEVLIFIITIILAMVDSSLWSGEFFYITMCSVIAINIANGIYQNSVYGLAAKLPMKYSNAVVLGSNISGTFTSLVNVISIWLSPNLRVAAIYYFLTALFVLLACFDTYFALPLNKFYRFYCVRENVDDDGSGRKREMPPYLFVFKKTWMQCLNVFMVFFVTLSIFPAVHAAIRPINGEIFGSIKETSAYFTPVCCFLVFNFFAMMGNIIPNWITRPGPKYLWIPIVCRFLLIPFFMFCNYNVGADPKTGQNLRQWPVFIENDYVFIAGGVVLGLSSGYFSSLCMMYAPKCVPQEHAGTAGMMAAFFLICGIFSGINFSFVLSWAVKQPWF